jgi:hypothetical protein
LATHLEHGRPSAFPFIGSSDQFWDIYGAIIHYTWSRYPLNLGYHVMISVIGVSFSAEYLLKGIYEATWGRVSEWIAGGASTSEDLKIARVAREYADFLHHTPWYEFPFRKKLDELWADPAAPQGSFIRRWERRLAFSAELVGKTVWAWCIRLGTQAGYDPEEETLVARVNGKLVRMPRYEGFRKDLETRIARGEQFDDIAGNQNIMVTLIAPLAWKSSDPIFEWKILTEPEKKRVALAVPVRRLHEVLPQWKKQGVVLDHVYDY